MSAKIIVSARRIGAISIQRTAKVTGDLPFGEGSGCLIDMAGGDICGIEIDQMIIDKR